MPKSIKQVAKRQKVDKIVFGDGCKIKAVSLSIVS